MIKNSTNHIIFHSAALNHNQNSAIFAPGWLVEKDRLKDAQEFWERISKVNDCLSSTICQNDDKLEFSISNVSQAQGYTNYFLSKLSDNQLPVITLLR